MPGLPTATLDYLADLAANNDDDWFHRHRDRYVTEWLDPARALVTELAPALADLDPDLVTTPRVDAGIRRVQRDRRFGPAAPYKPWLDVYAWHGDDPRSAPSGLWLRVHPDRLEISSGVRRLDGPVLRAHRDRVLDPEAGDALVDAVTAAHAAGGGLGDPDLAGVPRTHPTDDPVRVALLRRRHCLVTTTAAPPAGMPTARFVPWLVRRWAPQRDVHRWLVAHATPSVGTPRQHAFRTALRVAVDSGHAS